MAKTPDKIDELKEELPPVQAQESLPAAAGDVPPESPPAIAAPVESAPAVAAPPEEVKTPLPAFQQKQGAPKENCEPAPQGPKFPAPSKPSIGEKWWHRMTYGGFGYLANLGVSVVLWDFFIKRGGQPVFFGIKKGASGLFKGLGFKNTENMANAAAKYIFSPLGGHITMIPVKLSEDHARYITHRLNQALDPNYAHKDLVATPDTPEDELPPLFDEPNRNTWSQVVIRRLIGWGAVVGSGMALRATKLEQPLEDATLRVFHKGVDLTGSAALKRLSQTPLAQSYAQLAALDSYLTAVTTVITAMTKGTFGSARDESVPDDALSIDVPGVTQLARHAPSTPRACLEPVPDVAMESLPESRPAYSKGLEKSGSYADLARRDSEREMSHPAF